MKIVHGCHWYIPTIRIIVLFVENIYANKDIAIVVLHQNYSMWHPSLWLL